jgi:hypothetical protein
VLNVNSYLLYCLILQWLLGAYCKHVLSLITAKGAYCKFVSVQLVGFFVNSAPVYCLPTMWRTVIIALSIAYTWIDREDLKGQSHQILGYILAFGKLNKYFLQDSLWF